LMILIICKALKRKFRNLLTIFRYKTPLQPLSFGEGL
jgi:hypothetical protein